MLMIARFRAVVPRLTLDSIQPLGSSGKLASFVKSHVLSAVRLSQVGDLRSAPHCNTLH